MPRIEPDDDREHESWLFRGRWRSGWRRRLLTWALVAAGLGLGFLIPYTLYLDHQVTERFGQLRWQLPTRVYARPLLLAPGVAMDAKTLATELAAASYRDDGAGVRPGTYGHEGRRWRIASRGFIDVDGRIGQSRIEVVLSGGRVASLRDLGSGKPVRAARLDPARIATLYSARSMPLKSMPWWLLKSRSSTACRPVTSSSGTSFSSTRRRHGIDFSGMLRALFVT